MTDALGLLWVALMFALAGWMLAQLLVPLLLQIQGQTRDPQKLRRHLGLLALLPWLLPASTTVGMLVLAWSKQMGWIHDHCNDHPQHHPHFCLEHLPELMLDHGHSLFAVALLLIMGVPFVRLFGHFRAVARRLAPIRQLSHGRGLLLWVDDERTLGFAAGIRRPRIFLSRGMDRLLDKREQRIVLAHEVAHIRHHDLLHSAVLAFLLCLDGAPPASVLG